MITKKTYIGMTAAFGLLLTGCGSAGGSSADAESAENYLEDVCNGKVDVYVGYTAGGSTDSWTRQLAESLSDKTGADFRVTNVPGAGGSLAYNKVINAKKDGCTIGNFNMPSGLAYLWPESPVKYSKDDFDVIAATGYVANGIAVVKDSELKSVQELIDTAKADPGKLTAASDGPRSDDAIAYAQLKDSAGIEFNEVVLDGGADKVSGLLGGHVDFFGGGISTFLPQVRSGQVRVLCVYAEKPSKFLPDTPTCKSEGVDVLSDNRWSLVTTAGIPEERRQYLEDVVLEIAEDESYQEANEKIGITTEPMTSKELSKEWERQEKVYTEIISNLEKS